MFKFNTRKIELRIGGCKRVRGIWLEAVRCRDNDPLSSEIRSPQHRMYSRFISIFAFAFQLINAKRLQLGADTGDGCFRVRMTDDDDDMHVRRGSSALRDNRTARFFFCDIS